MVISTVSCLVMKGDDGYRVALGSVAPTPIRAGATEAALEGYLHALAKAYSTRDVSALADHATGSEQGEVAP